MKIQLNINLFHDPLDDKNIYDLIMNNIDDHDELFIIFKNISEEVALKILKFKNILYLISRRNYKTLLRKMKSDNAYYLLKNKIVTLNEPRFFFILFKNLKHEYKPYLLYNKIIIKQDNEKLFLKIIKKYCKDCMFINQVLEDGDVSYENETELFYEIIDRIKDTTFLFPLFKKNIITLKTHRLDFYRLLNKLQDSTKFELWRKGDLDKNYATMYFIDKILRIKEKVDKENIHKNYTGRPNYILSLFIMSINMKGYIFENRCSFSHREGVDIFHHEYISLDIAKKLEKGLLLPKEFWRYLQECYDHRY